MARVAAAVVAVVAVTEAVEDDHRVFFVDVLWYALYCRAPLPSHGFRGVCGHLRRLWSVVRHAQLAGERPLLPAVVLHLDVFWTGD